MFKNYLKIAFRNFLRQKTYSFINISGLAIGMTRSLLILLYVQHELSYDKFHENAKQIYRVISELTIFGKTDRSATTPAPMAPELLSDFPEILNAVRIIDFSSQNKILIDSEEKRFEEEGFFLVDPAIFDIFTLPFAKGQPKTALNEPYSMVITEEIAKKYFGEQDPMGKVLTLNNAFDFKITGILKNVPQNSHFRFNFLAPIACAEDLYESIVKIPVSLSGWRNYNCRTYLLLPKDYDPVELENKIPLFINKHKSAGAHSTDVLKFYLQPLTRIHLYSDFHSGMEPSGDIKYVYIFSAIAFFILLIACINFMNLTTARSTKRAKEVGVRKVLGANKQNLIKQFLGESILLTLIALSIAILLVELFFPSYQALLNKELKLSSILDMADFWGILLIILVVGVVAGSYPALYLSSFQAVKTLKGEVRSGTNKEKSRNILVILQFAISITLIICTMMINRQLHFVKDKELGFNKENTVVIPLIGDEIKLKSETLKLELSNLPGILNVTASSEVPYAGFTSNGYIPEGFKNPIMIHVVDVDEHFLETFDIDMVSGRNFSKEFSTDKTAYLINETLAGSLDWDDPIGKTINRNGDHKVIGVVKDFHFATMHSEIKPLILTNQPWRNRFNLLSVKINARNISATLGAIENTWRQFAQSVPFEYSFLDEAFDNLYKSEQRFQEMFFYFSLLAIVIALLGLFSLASFSTEQRTKEIGVRKVLGASVMGITGLLSKEFLKLVVIANIAAWPVAWYAMNNWLQNFAYRIDMEYWIFILAAMIAIATAILTVSFQAVKAATANPVEALKYE